MVSLLLVVIYLAFISLGLPDSVLGSAWPEMFKYFDVPVSYASVISIIISCGTIISALMSDKLIKKLSTGLIISISILLTCLALFGFSFSNKFYHLCIFAVPYGLGAGSIDTVLNNYVATHYKSRHMNWLHCFWGIGASVGPLIMSLALTNNLKWTNGYQIIGIIQSIILLIIIASLPLFKKTEIDDKKDITNLSILKRLRIPGVIFMLFSFISYCGIECIAGLWASSYLVLIKGLDSASSSRFASLFFLGITIGRFISGLFSDKLGDQKMIIIGLVIIFTGVIMIFIPRLQITMIIGLLVLGIGCAPIYPSLVHSTPSLFGKNISQSIISLEMASAYVASTVISPIFGLIVNYFGIHLYPLTIFILTLLLIGNICLLFKITKKYKSNL